MSPKSAAESLYDQIEAEGYGWIERTCAERRSEHLHLDFKTKARPAVAGAEREDFQKFAEALSGFGNSEGGVIVWGVDARRPRGDSSGPDGAQEQRPIEYLRRFRSDLEGELAQLVSPPPSGTRFFTINPDPVQDKGFLAILIPESDNPPHMSQREHRYFGRAGWSFFPLENFQVRDLMVRRQNPQLELLVTLPDVGTTNSDIEWKFMFSIHNAGRGIAKWPSVKLWPDGWRICEFELDGSGHPGFPKVTTVDGSKFYSGGLRNEVVFPGETRDVTKTDRFRLERIRWTYGDPVKDISPFKLRFQLFAEGMPTYEGAVEISPESIVGAVKARQEKSSVRPLLFRSQPRP